MPPKIAGRRPPPDPPSSGPPRRSSNARSMFSDMSNSIPGVDEAMSFAELMKMVQNMNFSCIVFDTAPTGHTLRLLSFPTIMDKALSKLMDLKNKFSGLFSQFGNMFGGGGVRRVVGLGGGGGRKEAGARLVGEP